MCQRDGSFDTFLCAPDEIIAAADLVTEMHEIKHYYTKGVEARRGIEN